MPSPADPAPESNAAPPPSKTTSLDERLTYLQIDETDRARLRELAPLLNARAADSSNPTVIPTVIRSGLGVSGRIFTFRSLRKYIKLFLP